MQAQAGEEWQEKATKQVSHTHTYAFCFGIVLLFKKKGKKKEKPHLPIGVQQSALTHSLHHVLQSQAQMG
jgi:hypothetical protein